MSGLGRVIAAEFGGWDGPRYLEEEIFGTGDPARIAICVDRFCSRALRSSIERYEFFATSVMSVHGVRLVDGRRVVVKVGRRRLGVPFLSAVQVVQAELAADAFPCPRPLLAPTAVEAGVAVVEQLLDDGVRACAHDAPIRAALAGGLARLVEVCRGFRALAGLGPSLLASAAAEELWPRPHDRRFDFAGTAAGAAWIDELAGQARVTLAASAGEIVVAHSDWRAEHVRFEGEQIVAAYDWHSLAVGREPALVGAAAHAFTADWGISQARRLPTLNESRAFVADYEAARGARFSQAERETINAAWLYATAYGARCEHSDAQLGLPWAKQQISDDSYRSEDRAPRRPPAPRSGAPSVGRSVRPRLRRLSSRTRVRGAGDGRGCPRTCRGDPEFRSRGDETTSPTSMGSARTSRVPPPLASKLERRDGFQRA